MTGSALTPRRNPRSDARKVGLESFTPVWDQLFPAEQARTLQLLVEVVTHDAREGGRGGHVPGRSGGRGKWIAEAGVRQVAAVMAGGLALLMIITALRNCPGIPFPEKGILANLANPLSWIPFMQSNYFTVFIFTSWTIWA
jgi:hypothetical protein